MFKKQCHRWNIYILILGIRKIFDDFYDKLSFDEDQIIKVFMK